jgi:hypothetical protein
MNFWTTALASFVGFMGGYIVSRTILYPVEEIADALRSRIYCYIRNKPYISPKISDEAEQKLMENYESIIQASENPGVFKVCPKCATYKKNFAKEGRNRVCMDCEFGDISSR